VLTTIVAAASAAPRGAITGRVYADARLTGYVGAVGGRLARVTGDPHGWRFVVLDQPDANAFALPDRRVLVTRGMIALANDEAELAAVLAHEIAHQIAGHGRVGAAGRQAAEFEADRLGLRYLDAAGYDPRAQASIQASLVAAHALDARLRGAPAPLAARAYAPMLVDRLRASSAATARSTGGIRGRDRHLAAIDGMVWGVRAAGLRLRVRRIAPGDDVAAMASAMPVGNAPQARFHLLNGLVPGEVLHVGDHVKLVGR